MDTITPFLYNTTIETIISNNEALFDEENTKGAKQVLSPEDIAYICIGSIGILGNGFVLIVIFNTKNLRKVVTTTFIINQSIIDGMTGLIMILSWLLDSMDRKFITLADDLYCRLWLNKATQWTFFMMSSLNLVAITIERLIAVRRPLWHKVSFTMTKRIIVIVLIWIFGPALNILHGLADSRITARQTCQKYGAPGRLSDVTAWIQVFFQFIFPVIVFTASYSIITFTLVTQKKAMEQNTNSRKIHGGRNVIKTMFLVNCCFLLCWSFNEVYFMMFLSGHKVNFNHPFYDFSIIAVFCNCCCNPFVYIIKYKNFQNGMRQLLVCRKSTVYPASTSYSAEGTEENTTSTV